MGRQTGDFLLGTIFLACAMLLAVSPGKSASGFRHPNERAGGGDTLHSSPWKNETFFHQHPAIADTTLQPACAVLKNLSRGTRIVVGSLDVSGGRHGFSVTIGSDEPLQIGSLPVTRCSANEIRRWRYNNSLFGPVSCSLETQAGLPVGVGCGDGSDDSPARIFLTPHFVDTGTVHETAECRLSGKSPRVRVYVDQRLVQSMSGRQFIVWSESLMSAAESRSLPIVEAWVGTIRDVDHDQKLSIVVTDLDRRGRHSSGSSPIHGCIRESDFRSDSDFCGDIIYIDPKIFELPTDELAALLTHEATHAAVCSLRPDDSIDTADHTNSALECTGPRIPAWLNEAVAHFVELQCSDKDVRAAGVSQNFQRRMDDFYSNPAGSPIVAAEDVLNLQERRGGSRGAATLFLARWFSNSETLQQFVRSQTAFDRRIEELAQAPFADVFQDWTLSMATLSARPTSPTSPTSQTSQTTTSCEQRALRFDVLPATGNPSQFSVLGTAFRCFECSEEIGSLVIESDAGAKLQISIIEPEAHISTMANAVTRHF